MTTPEQVSRATELVRKTCDLTGVAQEQVHRLVDAAEAVVCAIDARSAASDVFQDSETRVGLAEADYKRLRSELGLAGTEEVIR